MIDDKVIDAEFARRLQRESIQARELLVWTVTAGTKGYPGQFVARPHGALLQVPYRCCLTADTLDDLRDQLPNFLTMMAPDPADDPMIVEVWL